MFTEFYKQFLVFFLIFNSIRLEAQMQAEVFPLPGQEFYTTQIPFLLRSVPGAEVYQLEWGKQTPGGKGVSFNAVKLESPGIILRDFSFGEAIVWKYQALSKEGSVLYRSEERTFTIAEIPEYLLDFRLRVLEKGSGKEVYFFDTPGAAYDKQGNLVWFMKPGHENRRIMDLRLNPDGRISFIPVISPMGRGLITTLTLDTIFDAHKAASHHPMMPYLTFHHHMEVLPDRSILLVGDLKPSVDFGDLNMGTGNVKRFPQVILNMNQNGKVNWIWEADKILTLRDNDCYGHINSVAMHPNQKEMAISFKDLSRIMVTTPGYTGFKYNSINGIHEKTDKKKILMASNRTPLTHANVPAEPGRLQNLSEAPPRPSNPRTPPKPATVSSDSLPGNFSAQHSVQFNSKGNLVFFNNNSYNPNAKYSTLMEVEAPFSPVSPVKIVWEHVLQFHDSLPKKAMGRGNIQLINDYTFMTYMGQVSRIFESDTSLNIHWMGLIEHRAENRDWSISPGYKAFRASSLYPALYTVEGISQKNEKIIRISNLGSESDTYQLMDEKGKVYLKETIEPYSKSAIPIGSNWPEKLKVRSTLNPENERKVYW